MDESKRFLGIAYLYTIITAVFSITSYLQLFFYSAIDKYVIKALLLQFFIFAAIGFVLFMLNRKQRQHFLAISKDNAVRKSTGVVIIINGFTSLSVYLPQAIYAVSLIVNRNIDVSAVPTIVSVFLFLCQVLLGLFLFKCKSNTCGQYNAGTIIGIAYLYTLITVVFSLIFKLSRVVLSHISLNKYSFLWLAFIAAIIMVLYLLNKKQKQNLAFVLHDDIARKSAAILIIINGAVNFSVLSNSIVNVIWLLDSNFVDNKYAVSSITSSIIEFIIVLCQIGLGAYFLKISSNTDKHKRIQ